MAEGKKICPLMSRLANGSDYATANFFMVECREEQCAWWDSNNKYCAVAELTFWLCELANKR